MLNLIGIRKPVEINKVVFSRDRVEFVLEDENRKECENLIGSSGSKPED